MKVEKMCTINSNSIYIPNVIREVLQQNGFRMDQVMMTIDETGKVVLDFEKA